MRLLLSLIFIFAAAVGLRAQILAPILFGANTCCTFYVSQSSGSDSNPGTFALPWQTVAKVNAQTLSPGQSVGFKSGDTWRESLTVGQSGASGNPITYTSYGSGALPVITGADVVTGWTPSPTLQDTVGDTTNGGTTFGNNSAWQWIGGGWIAGSSYTLTQACAAMKINTGAPFTSSVTGSIYSNNAGVPGASLASATVTIKPTLTSMPIYYCFNFSGLSVTASTQYWLIMTTTIDAANYATAMGHTATGNLQKRSSNGTSWSTANTNNEYVFDTYSAGSGAIWQANVSNQPNVLIFNGVLGSDMASSISGVTSPGTWFWSSGILYVYATSNPAATVQAGNRVSAVDTTGKSYLNFSNLDLQGANGTNVYGPSDVSVAGANLYISYGGSHVTTNGITTELTGTYGIKIVGSDSVVLQNDTIRNFAGDYGFTRGDGVDVVGYETFNGSTWTRTGPSTNISVSNETLTGYFDRQGIAFEDVNGGTISNNTIFYTGPWAGIDNEPQPGWVVENVTVQGNNVVLSAPPAYAVNAYPSAGIAVNNTASGSTTGPSILVNLNTINTSNIANTNGVILQCSTGTITQCVASNNAISNLGGSTIGVVLSGTVGTATGNTLTSGSGHIGFYLENSTSDPSGTFDVEGNAVSGTFDNGVVVTTGANITAYIGGGNIFAGNSVASSKGIYVNVTSPPSVITVQCNSFSGWITNVSVMSGTVNQGCP